MIMTVDKFKGYVKNCPWTDSQIKEQLSAIEFAVRKITNNNFQQRNRRSLGCITDNNLMVESPVFKAGDTIEINDSTFNDGLYYVKSVLQNGSLELEPNDDFIDESNVLVTKINYPVDVQMGVLEALKWKMTNDLQNSGNMDRPIQSESLSRHTVNYGADSTEFDIDELIGVPKKLTRFLNSYIKARF